jgi:hypothetical protein
MQYLTSYGMIDGSSTIAILNEQAAFHGFTKTDIFDQEPAEPANQFYFKDRYSSKTFQGIVTTIARGSLVRSLQSPSAHSAHSHV